MENITGEDLRDGIFALRTRRFGTVAELMIQKQYNLEKGHNQFHDLYDSRSKKRVEVKFSTVMKANEDVITISNVIHQVLASRISDRAMKREEIATCSFDSNIQQVKCGEFDILYYGLFFSDYIAIFKMTSEEVRKCPGYSDKQHKGNEGEGQFHLHQDSIQYHFDNHFVNWITYNDLLETFKYNVGVYLKVSDTL